MQELNDICLGNFSLYSQTFWLMLPTVKELEGNGLLKLLTFEGMEAFMQRKLNLNSYVMVNDNAMKIYS